MATIFDEPTVQPKQSSGCLKGCLIAAGIGFALLLCAGVGTFFFVKNQIAKYTAEEPAKLPAVEYTEDQMAALETRMKSFKEAVDEGAEDEITLVVTADDINAMINRNKDLRGKAFIKIAEGKIGGDLSIPLEGIPLAGGRFFNGSAEFNVSMENDMLVVTLAEAEVNGNPVPQRIMDAMADNNLAQDAYKNPANAETLKRFKSIQVEDDKVILKLRPKEQPSEEPSETAEATVQETEATVTDQSSTSEPAADSQPAADAEAVVP